ncbi:pentapeptide repeat-containing protein [Streptomyces sp. HNM0574]|uniref:pentapeptide repeat-containing protein n=1 Tax=Streptomyces sp. HNM0574 TaxID=2714954 RepID=UPI001F109E8F|nr:pentapeptide repeat-containing protein [Streptomyces sp. HNM0574]
MGGGTAGVQRPEIALPALRPYDGSGLRPGGDYDGLEFADTDLSVTDAAGATFMDCGIYRCSLDSARWERARLIDTVAEGVWGVGTDLGGAGLRDVELGDVRMGGVQLHGGQLDRVLVRGGKIDFLNLRQAALKDVVFEGCVLVEPDFAGAVLERVAFPGCVLRGVDFTQATLTDVDLRDVAELDISAGAGRLSGAVIRPAQLMDLAPVFAAELGVRVVDG